MLFDRARHHPGVSNLGTCLVDISPVEHARLLQRGEGL
jgi:hypothetical protein